VFLDDGYCSAAAVEFDPDAGCNTYSPSEEAAAEEEWEDEELEEWEDDDADEDEEEWIDDEDEF
jgi:hypothetical protein